MPWIQNPDGSREYKLSIFAKEELPTWDEIYNEWYKSDHLFYDPDDVNDQKEDLYWKIPHKVYLLLTICNQFNKMIYEDGYRDYIIKMINATPSLYQAYLGLGNFVIKDLLFLIHDQESCQYVLSNGKDQETIDKLSNRVGCSIEEFLSIMESELAGKQLPPIYSIKMPNNQPNPFIVNDRFRIYSDQEMEFPRKLGITLYITTENADGEYKNGPVFLSYPFDDKSGHYRDMIEIMMKPFKDYFENGIGWKDENGDLISEKSKGTEIYYMGIDPAK